MPMLEIAVTSLEDAVRAEEGGADSIEVLRDLPVGGITPAIDLVAAIRAKVKLRVNVLVRPHARNFYLSLGEVLEVAKSIKEAVALGVNGIVCGGQNRRGGIDVPMMRDFVAMSGAVPVTLHRAIDLSMEPKKSLKKLPEAGVRRVLTAGPGRTAWEGRGGLGEWVERFGSELSFVVSGGLTLEQLPAILKETKAQEYHFGSAARTGDAVDAAKVRELRRALG